MAIAKINHFLTGLGFVASTVGLSLLGLAFGASVSGETGFVQHTLFMPGLVCMGAGVFNLLMISLTDLGESKE